MSTMISAMKREKNITAIAIRSELLSFPTSPVFSPSALPLEVKVTFSFSLSEPSSEVYGSSV
jgi:hypothetical protein